MGHSINASCVQKCLCMRKICASIFNLILVPKPSLDLVNGAESKFIGIELYDSDPKSVNLKFIYFEKATKFCDIFPLLLTVCTVVKSKGRFHKILWPTQNI